MNDETRKKRDEMAKQVFCVCCLHYDEAFVTGFDAGFALAKEQENEALSVAVETLEFYGNKKKVNQMINGTGDDFEEILGIFHGGKRARKALAEIRKLQGKGE